MLLRYLYHSGYMIEGDGFTIVIDYYNDKCSGERSAPNGVVDADTFGRPGKLYVLSSHAHGDHFIPRIFDWRKHKDDIQYILSSDIRARQKDDTVFMGKGDVFDDGCLHAKAFGSTDQGISFLLHIDGKTIFHAGDLNNWHWNEEVPANEAALYERNYLRELKQLQGETAHTDLAMFPVDPRLGKDYMRGAQQFVETIETTLFAPMHFGDAYDAAAAFAPLAQQHGAQCIQWTHRGQAVDF